MQFPRRASIIGWGKPKYAAALRAKLFAVPWNSIPAWLPEKRRRIPNEKTFLGSIIVIGYSTDDAVDCGPGRGHCGPHRGRRRGGASRRRAGPDHHGNRPHRLHRGALTTIGSDASKTYLIDLQADVTLADTWDYNAKSDVTIKGNGHTIFVGGGDGIRITGGGTLTLGDADGDGESRG